MASHRAHPVHGDPAAALFYDDCPGCERHANGSGLTLDEPTLARAWNLMLDVERGGSHYRTGAEQTLCLRLHEFALLMERHPGLRINPWLRMDAEEHDPWVPEPGGGYSS